MALSNTAAASIKGNTIHANRVRLDTYITSTVLSQDSSSTRPARTSRTPVIRVSTEKETEATGGGFYIVDSSAVMTDNFIFGNSNESGEGGGFFVNGSAITMTNNVVAQNSTAISTSYAAGLYINASSATLHHLTVADNTNESPDSGALNMGIYVTGSTTETSQLDLANSIISGHQLGLVLSTGSTGSLLNNLFSNFGSNWDGGGVFEPASGNRIGDPRFVDSENGDYHIQRTSDAFDIGTDLGVATDIEGTLRPRAFGPDAGAYEQHYPNGVHLKVSASPLFVGSGETIEYTVQVVNHSNAPIAGVGLNFSLPGQQSATSISGTGCSGTQLLVWHARRGPTGDGDIAGHGQRHAARPEALRNGDYGQRHRRPWAGPGQQRCLSYHHHPAPAMSHPICGRRITPRSRPRSTRSTTSTTCPTLFACPATAAARSHFQENDHPGRLESIDDHAWTPARTPAPSMPPAQAGRCRSPVTSRRPWKTSCCDGNASGKGGGPVRQRRRRRRLH